jgi:mannose-1-phosphate guanylyltransferase
MVAQMQKYEQELGVKITFSVETEPLGTAGPLALAKEILGKDNEPFFVLNSDVICLFPFEQMKKEFLKSGGEGMILVTKVEEPSKYGVVVTKTGTTQIDRFVEKPQEYVGNRINAGLYIFHPKILNRIEVRFDF